MVALTVGIILLVLAAIAVLPFGFNWGADVLLFLRGMLPVLAVFIGLIAAFIGVADIKDRMDAKKEEEEEKQEEAKAKTE